jgi:transcription antitermination protein NusB
MSEAPVPAPREPRRHWDIGRRQVARRLALQALYRWQINPGPWQDLVSDFATDPQMAQADPEYFRDLVEGVWTAHEALDAQLAGWIRALNSAPPPRSNTVKVTIKGKPAGRMASPPAGSTDIPPGSPDTREAQAVAADPVFTPARLDPVEHALLLIGLYELRSHPEVPCKAAITEAVNLAKRFGSADSHKYVNAVLDRAARAVRPGELL